MKLGELDGAAELDLGDDRVEARVAQRDGAGGQGVGDRPQAGRRDGAAKQGEAQLVQPVEQARAMADRLGAPAAGPGPGAS